MHRKIAALFLALVLLPPVWLGNPGKPANFETTLSFTPVPLPHPAQLARLGEFRLEAIWSMDSPNTNFGGYSALLPRPDGRLLALTDFSDTLIFSPPQTGAREVQQGEFATIANPFTGPLGQRDTEAATIDPATGRIWQAVEGSNAIDALSADLRPLKRVQPAVMSGWGVNGGPESLVRLADGRFVTVRELGHGPGTLGRHAGVVFEGDPLEHPEGHAFTFEGPPQFSVTDMAQMPDGRVLILMRRLIWPVHPSFASRLAIADPADIRPGGIWRAQEVARIASSMPIDNFEGLAVVPRKDGRLTIWIIADDNRADWQQTILWRLSVDPSRLP